MTEWIRKENVKIDGVYEEKGGFRTYLLKLRIPKENSIFCDEYEIYIQDSKFYNDLIDLKDNKRERCYFAFGMQDIDFYKLNDKCAITHSPHEGLNIQLVLADGQLEEILKTNVAAK